MRRVCCRRHWITTKSPIPICSRGFLSICLFQLYLLFDRSRHTHRMKVGGGRGHQKFILNDLTHLPLHPPVLKTLIHFLHLVITPTSISCPLQPPTLKCGGSLKPSGSPFSFGRSSHSSSSFNSPPPLSKSSFNPQLNLGLKTRCT